MLFNSYAFILLFLPTTLLVVLTLRRLGRVSASLYALCLASLVFYAAWDWRFLGLLVGSICFNYLILTRIAKKPSRALMWFGILVNVALLAFFKYATFIGENLAAVTGSSFTAPDIVLPLAISFFTLQQISIIVDSTLEHRHEPNFRNYALYVSFFPQLIAGPIVRHNELLPQIRALTSRIDPVAAAMGATLFTIGLFKKVFLADSLKPYADVIFNAADQGGGAPGLVEAWLGAFSYHFQIYFDFSGYSDMAIGLALLFGFRLPLNFASPYKAASIIDFWRQWHLTLSHFLRDYIYIPLGGNRNGLPAQSLRIMLVMLIGGLWHGSSWNFVIWGGLHGAMIVVNHLWRRLPRMPFLPAPAAKLLALLVTTLGVVLAWVFFRAETLDGALLMLSGMFGLHGLGSLALGEASLFDLARAVALGGVGVTALDANALVLLITCSLLVWFVPASQQLVNYQPETPRDSLLLRFPLASAALAGSAFSIALLALARPSEFLYFQF